MEILFQGPLTNANDAVKCNYIIYWSGETGMELVDKWETEEKITDDNRNQIARYFKLFEEHISPKSNALITIVKLKRLFQESMSLEDFHTKALRLVKEAKYPEGATQNRVLQDTIISGLASDKIRAKIIKEGKDVTLARVMEIALARGLNPETPQQDAGDCKSQLCAVWEGIQEQKVQTKAQWQQWWWWQQCQC